MLSSDSFLAGLVSEQLESLEVYVPEIMPLRRDS